MFEKLKPVRVRGGPFPSETLYFWEPISSMSPIDFYGNVSDNNNIIMNYLQKPVMVPTHLTQFITLPVPEFCRVTGLGQTLTREMLKDGRLQAFRAGKKRLLVVVQSYLDLVAKQQAEGVPEFDNAVRAREVRREKIAARKAVRPTVDLADLKLL